jgi:hypothetical protein
MNEKLFFTNCPKCYLEGKEVLVEWNEVVGYLCPRCGVKWSSYNKLMRHINYAWAKKHKTLKVRTR